MARECDHLTDDEASSPALDDLATRWLDAETRSHGEPANAAIADEAARLGEAYEAAIAAATQEDLRISWEAAVRRQSDEEVGSASWADARRVSELLRTEYLALKDAPPAGS